mmetsp:Transcript_21611/g.49885  ORF Transcript_21611/g.49885 Transcript_21611/m.49885 type:complete len:125 (+) Transcript_21611:1158-1532(+)
MKLFSLLTQDLGGPGFVFCGIVSSYMLDDVRVHFRSHCASEIRDPTSKIMQGHDPDDILWRAMLWFQDYLVSTGVGVTSNHKQDAMANLPNASHCRININHHQEQCLESTKNLANNGFVGSCEE